MKSLLIALSLSIPTLSFACIDLSGTYAFCKSDHVGDDQVRRVTLVLSNAKLSLNASYDEMDISTNFFLDGIPRTSATDVEGTPATMTTRASCAGRDVNIDFTLEVNAEQFKSGYSLTKDHLGRLVITESLEGEYLSQTTCEQIL